MGRCSYIYVMDRNLEDISQELKNWVNGETNDKLEKWFKEFGINFV